MTKVLILCAHRPNRSPSQRFRFEQYLTFLESHGFSFTYSFLLNKKDDHIFYSQGKLIQKVFILLKSLFIRLKDVLRFKKFDFIFIQREAGFLGTSSFESFAFHSGAKVIFDFDDSIWIADTSPGNKKWEWVKRPQKFFNNVSYAYSVIAGNAYLAQIAKPHNKNIKIIPSTIDTEIHKPLEGLKNKYYTTIGWSGSISTIKHFEILIPVFERLKSKYGEKIKFKITALINVLFPAAFAPVINIFFMRN